MMMKEFRFLKRKQKVEVEEEEIENVPVNVDLDDRSSLSSMSQTSIDLSSRPPLNSIKEVPNPRLQHEHPPHRSKLDRTPTKSKQKPSETAYSLRTPDRHVGAKGRLGWAQRNNEEASGFPHLTPRSTTTTRVTGKANSGYSETNSTQSTPTKSVMSKPSVGRGGGAGGRGGNGAGGFAALYRGLPISAGGGGSVVNTVEVPHFELKEDPSFWMDHNVQVLIRVRPLNSIERSTHGYNRCLKQESAQSITWIGQPETRFTFDHVACETIDQETLFQMAGLPMVENCLSGYNSCIFAYGQTGSGKTYTMLGEIDNLEHKPSTDRGMTPRIFEFLFARIQAEEEIRRDERLKYNCKCSFLEIYNEQITDLLDPSSSNLLLREDVKKGVYVENLLECEVHSVSDILKLLTQGSLNRKVAATNMNRESSRSHSVFTCVIESRWEKDSTTNLRFARLNLVDLAGSERQKSSGAEGERLKEAANINKSLSSLGHVIMILVDVVHGKQRHVPYRDSRLTFLLQDSLGGNSKTMIIANVSPSICCAAETLNTLKFAQRAKLIQNNAVVNEDSTGDVLALQHQIRLLKEELSALKCQNVFRPLSFGSDAKATAIQKQDNACTANNLSVDGKEVDNMLVFEPKGSFMLSTKQLKSLETTLAGALRREQMAEACIKKLEAEIEQLNRLVRQREEDTRSTKMMLRFREDKIQRMESLLGGSLPPDSYLLEDNRAQLEEIQLLRAKVDKNPEVTRFALENIRLLDQLRRFQELYEEGEREILLDEISNLREQLLQFLGSKSLQHNHLNLDHDSQECTYTCKEGNPYHSELNDVLDELEDCRSKLNSCLEENEKLKREVQDLHFTVKNLKFSTHQTDSNINMNITKDSPRASYSENLFISAVEGNLKSTNYTSVMNIGEEILDLQLEVDILKIIIKEERSSRAEVEARAFWLKRNLELAESKLSSVSKECEDANCELSEAKTVIAALESQQILAIEEMEDLRKNNSHHLKLLSEKDLEVMNLKEQIVMKELRCKPSNNQERQGSNLQRKLKRMQDSLDKAKRLNTCYQNDHAFQASNEEEMDEVRRQAEAETAEVIVCMQEELLTLEQQVQNFNLKETETKNTMLILETELNELQEKVGLLGKDNERLHGKLQEKDMELRISSEQWQLLTCELEEVLSGGQYALVDASEQLAFISSSISERRNWISGKVGMLTRQICEKDLLIEELSRCLEDANTKRIDLEFMLQSLRGAALVINEVHQQECSEKEKETALLRFQLTEKVSNIVELEKRIELAEHEAAKASKCATVAFVIVNHLSEVNFHTVRELRNRDVQLTESAAISLRREASLLDQAASIKETAEVIQSLRLELVELKATCATFQQRLSEEEEHACSLEKMLEDIEENNLTKTREKLAELNAGILSLRSCMGIHVDPDRSSPTNGTQGAYMPVGDRWTDVGEDLTTNITKRSCGSSFDQKIKKFSCCSSDAHDRENAFIHLEKEIECALRSLKEVQVEITMQHAEKEQSLISGKQYQEGIQSFSTQLIALQTAICYFEQQFESKIKAIDLKLLSIEQTLHEAVIHWRQTKEFLELEIGDANIYAAQKAAETSCIYAKFEEAQDTLKEADIMLNELMMANGKKKLDLERLEQSENRLVKERDKLIDEMQRFQSINNLKDQRIQDLEDQYGSELMQTRDLIMELEVLVSYVQTSYEESFKSVKNDIHDLEAVILESGELVQSWLEDVWCEIIVKDCAVSVMHLCHVSVLLETVTGLNAEKGLLHHGLCDSYSVIADLRKHNSKTSKELKMFRTLQGKLLLDITSGFDRISRKEEEAGELGDKLANFERKILDLQLQEESMFQRANHMGYQLTLLMEELHLSNSNIFESLSNQDKMLKDRQELLTSQTELFITELQSKDVELCIMESQLEEMGLQKAEAERGHMYFSSLLEKLMTELIASMVDTEMKGQLLVAKEADIALRQKEVEEAQQGAEKFLSMLTECNLRHSEMDEVNKDLVREIELLKHVTRSNDALRVELAESVETKARLTDQIQALEAEKQKLREQLMIHLAKLEEFGSQKNIIKQERIRSGAVVENLKKDLILLLVERGLQEQVLLVEEGRAVILQKEVQEAHRQSLVLLLRLKHSNLGNRGVDEEKGGCLERGIQPLSDAAQTSAELKVELGKLMETKERLFSCVEELEGECKRLLKDLKTKETALVAVDRERQQFEVDISARETLINKLQEELDMKESELSRMSCVEEENMSLKSEVGKLKNDSILILQDLEKKNIDIESSLKRNHDIEVENLRMLERSLALETAIASLQSHLEMKNSQAVHMEDLCSQRQDVEELFGKVNKMEDENVTLRDELGSFKKDTKEALTRLAQTNLKSFNLLENARSKGQFQFETFEKEGFNIVEKLFHDICGNVDKISEFIKEIECLECHIKDLVSYNTNLNTELLRKDDILKGLLFDLSLLQESASNNKDQKDKVEKIMASFEALEDELLVKSGELDESAAHIQILEGQFQEKIDLIFTLESNYMKERESFRNCSAENLGLRSQIEEVLGAKFSLEEELTEKKNLIENLETGLSQMGNDVHKMSDTVECLRSKLTDLTEERDKLQMEISCMKEELEKAQAFSDENEAVAIECRQIAESTKIYADEKEAEVKLLVRSIEELECTINVLESKVDILKGEAERQRLQREELELELHAVNHQMLNVKSADTDIKRYLNEKERELEQAVKRITCLEMDTTTKDKEIAKCKEHISELILNAEAQACEYKQKFKELEAMAEKVNPEGHVLPHIVSSSSNKSEKNTVKSRGSGSPFKCIGLGLAQQMKSEKDEELTAARFRIEELESQAACRQKEIFALNARLATAESMTHDVIRDLLGVKLDMTNYMSLLDDKQVHKIAEKVQLSSLEPQVLEAEILKLKQQLNEFVEERRGWLKEIDKKHAEMVSANVELEKLRQQDQLLTTENGVLKMENANHKKRVMELEGEVEKLSGQQNLQQRIHHHAKIKEENNVLKLHNEDLRTKLQRAKFTSARVKEELAYYRASVGKSPCTNFDEEQRLMNKLKELEDDKMQVAQKLLAMCTGILKIAGITKPISEINPAVAEEALEHIKDRITSLERELQDLILKNRIYNERIRLLELMPQASPMNSRTDENYSTPRRAQASFLSDFER